MPEILKGDIKTIYVKDLELNEGNVENIILSQRVLKKDVEFYRNFLGVLISFDYNSPLPDYDDAYSYVKQLAMKYPLNASKASCFFIDKNDVRFDRMITKKEFKELKKKYKNLK